MSTKLYVMNEALGLLQTARMNDPEQADETGREMRQHWYPAVKFCIESSCPNFATERSVLQPLAVKPAFGFRNYFQKPGGCIRLLEVTDSEMPDPNAPQISYSEEAGKIAANASTLYLRWVSAAFIERIGDWPSTFADWVAADLARRARKLNTSRDVTENIGMALKTAKRAFEHFDATQNPPARQRSGRWSTARFGHRGGRRGDPGRY